MKIAVYTNPVRCIITTREAAVGLPAARGPTVNGTAKVLAG